MLKRLSEDKLKRRLMRGDSFISDTTHECFEGDINEGAISTLGTLVSLRPSSGAVSRPCLLFGYGSQSRRTYSELKKQNGIRTLWDGPILPIWAYPISLIAACHGGLLLIEDSAATARALTTLAFQAMVELYSFSQALVPEVKAHVAANKWRSRIGSVICKDPSYFCLGIDGDNAQAKTGVFAWCSWGRQCPDELVREVRDWIEAQSEGHTPIG